MMKMTNINKNRIKLKVNKIIHTTRYERDPDRVDIVQLLSGEPEISSKIGIINN